MSVTRSGFVLALDSLQQDILRMGSLVEEAIAKAVESLRRQDETMAQKVIDGDLQVDTMESEIEDKCMKLMATQQPMAKDLRRIGAAIKIITDLERMADYAADIAKVTLRIAGQPLIKPLIDIPRMAQIAQKMVQEALDSYVREDVQLARSMAADDDQVDHLHNQIFRELLVYMMEDPRTISQATYLLFVSRYLERIADHATNIGERVIFLVTGVRPALND